MENTNANLELFRLSEATVEEFNQNKDAYNKAAGMVVNSLYEVFFEYKHDILGINHRLKSESSMREKMIRRKFYKAGKSAPEILDAIPDIIGVMVECEFLSSERKLFEVIESYFNQKHPNGFYYNQNVKDLFIDLDVPQPIIQKNGNELFKMDCFYMIDGQKVNFELQIKSLVNSFWCEVEHNIVYKNNYYLPNDDYINEMMDSVRMNLLGLDKILSLINSRIDALNSYTVMKDLELNESLATQLISDLLNKKMYASLGFTVDVKVVRNLLTVFLMKKVKKLEKEKAFYRYLNKFRNLLNQEISFSNEIILDKPYTTESMFKQILGDNLITVMNHDFEWHAFFIMLFHIDGGNKTDSLDSFLNELETMYCNGELFERLKINLNDQDADSIQKELGVFIAEALSQIIGHGVQKASYYRKNLDELNGFLKYTLNCIDSFDDWQEKKSMVHSVINKIITNG